MTHGRGELAPEDYRLIAEGGHDWESWIAPDDSLRWTSQAGFGICGYTPGECRAMTRFPWPLVAKDDHITFELFDHLVGEQRPGNDLPLRLVRKDGSVIWVTASWKPLHDAAGSYQGVLLSIRDRSWSLHNRYLDHFRPVAIELLAEIMPAARAGDMQRVYRLMTERASRALGVARVGIWMFDDSGQSLVAADRFSSLDFLHLEGAVLSLEQCPRYRAALTGDQLVVATDAMNDPVTSELADFYLKPLGIASMLDAPIVRKGRTIGVICHEHVGHMRSWYETELAFVESLSDFVTLALYANEGAQLAERNRMLASIVEVLPDPVVTVGLDGNPVYVNRAAAATHEPRAETGQAEFRIQHISESYSPEALKFRSEVVVPTALKNGFWNGEVRLKTTQGTEIPVWQTMVAHHDRNGELKLLTSILRDLREQKAVESRLRESETALRTLNAQLEVRSADRARRLEQLEIDLTAFAAAVTRELEDSGSTAGMRALTEALVFHSQAVRRDAQNSRFLADDLVRAVLKDLKEQGRLDQVKVDEDLEAAPLEADAEFFRQIISQLLDNAIKFSAGAKAPSVGVSLRRRPDGLHFTVTDNGPGFDVGASGCHLRHLSHASGNATPCGFRNGSCHRQAGRRATGRTRLGPQCSGQGSGVHFPVALNEWRGAGQPFGRTMGRSRSSRTQSAFSMRASRPSSRSTASSP